jgi:hypothetical protein
MRGGHSTQGVGDHGLGHVDQHFHVLFLPISAVAAAAVLSVGARGYAQFLMLADRGGPERGPAGTALISR